MIQTNNTYKLLQYYCKFASTDVNQISFTTKFIFVKRKLNF